MSTTIPPRPPRRPSPFPPSGGSLPLPIRTKPVPKRPDQFPLPGGVQPLPVRPGGWHPPRPFPNGGALPLPVGPRRAAEDSFTRLEASPHRKNKRPSNREKHEQGQATVQRSQGGEKADKRRPNNDKAKNR